jgi:heat shock protein HspQ
MSDIRPTRSAPRKPAPKKAAVAKPRAKRKARTAKFAVGSVVRHKFYPFRGLVFDVDPVFDNTDEWWLSIPVELRPKKNQPFYHLLAENSETEYIAYVSEQNLLPDKSGEPLRHPKVAELFVEGDDGRFRPIYFQAH